MWTRAILVATCLASARCSSCKSSAPADGGAAVASASARAPAGPTALSLPIAADHDAAGNVYVVGFVAAQHALVLTRFDETGRAQWNAEALGELSYSSDAHADVLATPHGAVVVWRGIREKKRTRVARWIGEDGTPSAATFSVGSSACAQGDTMFSIGGKSGSSIVARHLPDGTDKTVVTLPDGRDPALVCGDGKRALVVDDGEDDVGVRAIENEKSSPRAVLVSTSDLDADEMREHEDFTLGDTLGQVLLTEKGHLVLRQYDGATVTPKRLLDHVVGTDEDLMAADGNTSRVVAIVAREAGARCDGDLGTDVLAIDVPLPDGKESVVDVTHGDCGRDLGPYWVAPTADAIYVAWAVRGPRSGDRAPVEALAWAKLGGPVNMTTNTVKLSAEDVVFAGCVKGRCAFVALDRPEGTDGMVPGAARVISIP